MYTTRVTVRHYSGRTTSTIQSSGHNESQMKRLLCHTHTRMRTHIHVHAHIRPNGQQSSAARDRIFSRLSWVRRQWVLTRSTCSPSDIGSSPFSTKTYYRHLIFVKDHGRKQKRIHTSHAHAPTRTPTFAQPLSLIQTHMTPRWLKANQSVTVHKA